MYTYACMYIYIYIRTYIHIHTHTHAQTVSTLSREGSEEERERDPMDQIEAGRIRFNDLSLGQLLGSGSFADVYRSCVCVWLCVWLCVQEFENFLPSQNEGDEAVARAQSKRRRVA